MWDADQYERFRGERSRPFFDLLSRIPDQSYRSIVDLGCGTGDLTAALADHWPEAHVRGVDQSEEMLVPARERAEAGRLEFLKGDLASWRPEAPADLIVSNAAIQWVQNHDAVLRHLASYLGPKGVLAVQMPANFDSPSHQLLQKQSSAKRWAGKLKKTLRHDVVQALDYYVELGWTLGLKVDAWETIYQHVLPGKDAVLEWMKGTALRPVMKALEGADLEAFLAGLAKKLRVAYPETPSGTRFPFRRIFFIARKG
ncbi:MAG TPA: methyltransferase domain-containing protein [Planctomycetota bacterium]|jgi:trans-aconitate 2-methyltransferase|nr:methyltransferase domain-containing protein [Planctomycetota bacterium]